MGDERKMNGGNGTCIGGTVYMVETVISESARENVYSKMKRLILSNINPKEMIADNRNV